MIVGPIIQSTSVFDLRYDISIDRFVRGAGNTLFFFSYRCYADGRLVLELKDACAGFFDRSSHNYDMRSVVYTRLSG